MASQDTTSPSEAGTSSSSAWCAGEQGTKSFCKTCNGPSTARQSRPQRAAAQEKVKKLEKALGNYVRRGGAKREGQSAAAVPALDVQVEQCESFTSRSQRRLGRAGQTTSGRGRTLERSEGPVGIGRRAVSRSVFCDKCRQRVDTVACPSRGATCRNRSSSEVSPSVDGRGPPSLDNVPPLPTANVKDVEHG